MIKHGKKVAHCRAHLASPSLFSLQEITRNADRPYRFAMKRIALAMILVCSTAAAPQDGNDPGARQTIVALEHAWDRALESSDVRALSAIFDSRLIYVDYDGKLLTKAEYLLRVKSNDTHLQQVVAEEMDVQIMGTTAIVAGTYRVKGVEKGKAYLQHGRFIDIWVLMGKNWICVASSTTPILR
jgi:ketosteroid isomerase-like protein